MWAHERAGWVLVAGLFAACGGNEFASTGSGGSAGASGSGASAGASGSGGGATGGSGGTATGGTTSGGAAGTTNGGTGGTPNGGTGGSATGGAAGTDGGSCPAPKPECGFSDPLPALYSTLDDASAVTSPARGSGSGQSHGNFVCGACSQALHVTQAGEYARFDAQSNIVFSRGSVDFFYRPQHPQSDAAQHNLVVVPGKFQILLGTNGAFAVGVQRQDGTQLVTAINSSAFSYTAGQWLRISVTWDFTQAGKNVHVYFDGNEIGANVPGSSGVQTMATPDGGDQLYLCANGQNDPNNCNGEIDDFKVYDVVLSF